MSKFTFPSRTIQHPGFEFFEQDLSVYKEYENSLSGLFLGFACQGPIAQPIDIRNEQEFIKFFGQPENEAEYYLYKGVSEYVNSKPQGPHAPYATVIRLPYDNDLCNIKDFTQRHKAIKYTIKTDNTSLGDYKPLYEKTLNFKNLSAESILITTEELNSFANETSADFIIFNKFNCPLKNGEEIFVSVLGRGNALATQGFISKAPIDIFNYNKFNHVNENTVGKKPFEWGYSVVDNININLIKCVPQIGTVLFKNPATGFYNRYVSQTNNEQNITVVVSKIKKSSSERGKYTIELLETFTGSIFSDSIDLTSRESNYIGDIINANSTYIGFVGHKSYKGFKRGVDELFVRDQTPIRLSISKKSELDKFILRKENTLTSSWLLSKRNRSDNHGKVGYATNNPEMQGGEWHINHNLDSENVVIQIENLRTNNIVVYNDIQVIDKDNIVVKYNYDGVVPPNVAEVIILKNDYDGYTEVANNLEPIDGVVEWNINHGLNSEKLIVQLYDNEGHLIVTQTKINDPESVTIKLYSDEVINGFKVVIIDTTLVECANYSELSPSLEVIGGQLSWKIKHNIGTDKVLVQVMNDETNDIIDVDIFMLGDDDIEVRLNAEGTEFEQGAKAGQFRVSIAGIVEEIIEEIDYSDVVLPIILNNVGNYREYTFTDIFDCGSSSIIALATSDKDGNLIYNPDEISDDIKSGKWLNYAKQIGRFCKYKNPYCVAHLDAPKTLTLKGSLIRTFDLNIPEDQVITAEKLLNLEIQDNSYLSINVTWLEVANEYLKYKHFIPGSCKFARCVGALNEPFTPPVGIENGQIYDVTNVSLLPEYDTRDVLYTHGFNYVSTLNNGQFYFDGQKTCWNKDYQLNRINVRRLINHLKRYTINVGKSYVGQTNNAVTRENLKTDLSQEFERCKLLGALDSYSIDVGADINSELVIKDGEVRVQIIVKPVSCIEFVLACFTIYRTGVSMMDDLGSLTNAYQ